MKFWIQQPAGAMAVGSAVVNGLDLSALPDDVFMVEWNGDVGLGEIEYSDAVAIRTKFTDPTPYLAFVDAWLTAATLTTPAVNLAQAKQVKSDVVDTLFNFKRQAPISSLFVSWDARDEAVIAMAQPILRTAAAVSTSAVNAAFHSFTVDINTRFAALVADINVQLSDGITLLNTTLDAGALTGGVEGTPGDPPTLPTLPTGLSFENMVAQVVSGVTVTEPTADPLNADASVPWPVYGSGAPVALTYSQLNTVILAIDTRRASLHATRSTKLNAIAELSTVASVIAFNPTTGW